MALEPWHRRHRELHAAKSRRWYEANRERKLAKAKEWKRIHPEAVKAMSKRQRQTAGYRETKKRSRERHGDRIRAQDRDRYKTDSEWRLKRLEKNRRWYQENKDKSRRLAHLKRARHLNASGAYTPEQARGRATMFGDRCWVCGGPNEAIDHVIPLSRGGTNWPANLRPICTSCNSSKGNKRPSEWLARKKTNGIK